MMVIHVELLVNVLASWPPLNSGVLPGVINCLGQSASLEVGQNLRSCSGSLCSNYCIV